MLKGEVSWAVVDVVRAVRRAPIPRTGRSDSNYQRRRRTLSNGVGWVG